LSRVEIAALTFAPASKPRRIQRQAFYGCSLLKSIYIPASVGFVGEMSFAYCNLLAALTFEAFADRDSGIFWLCGFAINLHSAIG
jgi:hypothetical protein